MSSDPNPFASPQAAGDAAAPTDGGYAPAEKRPKSPMVFGVIGVVVGLFGAIGGVTGIIGVVAMQSSGVEAPGLPSSALATGYMWLASLLGLVASGLLFAAGIGLVRYRLSGPKLFTPYAYLSIFLMIIGVIYGAATMSSTIDQVMAQSGPAGQAPQMAPQMRSIMMGSIIFGFAVQLLWLVYPILGLVMLNKDGVKAHLT